MILAALILAAALAVLAVVIGVVTVANRARLLPGPPLVSKTVVVHSREPDAPSIRGVLVGQHADRVILREAVYLGPEGTVDAEGLIHVPAIAISSIQELAAPAE